ncbi:hypothetical protein OGZ32_05725 [Lactococcus lactis]|nr:hypothetical protein [Lactococcus lactis]MDG4954839.1 hypothetical protein [Lactococcus lactis]
MNDNLIEEGVEIRNGLIIKSIQKEDILELWQISYGPKSDLHWMSFNAPYFEEPILSWEEFSRKISLKKKSTKCCTYYLSKSNHWNAVSLLGRR